MNKMSRIALITGISRGIGRATALRFAKAGYIVAGNYLKHVDDAKSLEETITKSSGICFFEKVDVCDSKKTRKFVSEVIKKFGKIDVLINNAGIYHRKKFDEITFEELEETMRVNFYSAFHFCKEVVPYMKKARSGRIISMASQLAWTGSNWGTHYTSTKGALVGFSRSLARELAEFNITVNVVAPGPVDTDIMAYETPEMRKAREENIPIRRIAKPEEVAEVLLFLAGTDSSYITGQVIHVSGGIL